MRSFLRNLLLALAIAAGVVTLGCLVALAMGLRPFILTSGSMRPLYTPGSLCLIDIKPEVEDLEIGDVVVYRVSTGALVMHRLVGEGLLQGDANDEAQAVELTRTNFVGREVFSIPGLGDFVTWVIEHKSAIIIIVIILVILACLPLIHFRRRQT